MLDMRNFRDYLRHAEKQLSMAEDAIDREEDAERYLIPAIILAWSAVESFVNSRCDDLNSLPSDMFELHERAFLLEKRLRFVDHGADLGKFILEGNEYQALENKIFFLLAKLGSRDTSDLKGGALWQRLRDFKEVRDSLVHPRRATEKEFSAQDVNGFIETAKEVIQITSERIWKTRLDF